MMHSGDATDMSVASPLDRNRLGRFESCVRGDYVRFEFYLARTMSSGEVCGACGPGRIGHSAIAFGL